MKDFRFHRTGITATNHSLIYVNFATNSAQVYDQTVVYSWYDMMGTFFVCLKVQKKNGDSR